MMSVAMATRMSSRADVNSTRISRYKVVIANAIVGIANINPRCYRVRSYYSVGILSTSSEYDNVTSVMATRTSQYSKSHA